MKKTRWEEYKEKINGQEKNTAVGHNAGKGVGGVGNYNTFIGANTYQVGNGINNTYLGYGAYSNGTYDNSTAIGTGAVITQNNQIKLGTNTSDVYCGNNLLLQGNGSECYIRNTTASALFFGTENYNYMNISSSGLTVNKASGTLLTLQNTAGLATGSESNIDFRTGQSGFLMARISALDLTANINAGFTGKLRFFLSAGGNNAITEHMSLTDSGLTAKSFNATSDYREKENVVPLDDSFTIDGLNPVTYNLKSSGRQDIGFIAHEVQEFYPFLVLGEKDGKDTQSLNYNGFIGILTKEIKGLKKKVAKALAKAAEQDARIVEQEARLAEQEARLAEQERKATEQEARIQALEKMMLELMNK